MIDKVKAYMRKWNMVSPHDVVYAGVSGGADSVCMLLILAQLAGEFPFSLRVIHVEHGIRGEESRQDADFVQKLCENLGLPIAMVSVDVPSYAAQKHLGLEEAARALRYQAFLECASDGEHVKVALAHHMEDNAETMLFQMVRGSGIDGLCGIRPCRKGENGVDYIRPLLCCSRSEIELFLESRGQTFCTDLSNGDTAFSRNRIRLDILPVLKEINPQAVVHINRALEDLGKLRDTLDEVTDPVQPSVVKESGHGVALEVEGLQKQPEAVRMRLIRRACAMALGTGKDLTRIHLQAVEALLQGQTGQRVSLPEGLWARRSYGEILLFREKERGDRDLFCEITEEMLRRLAESDREEGLTVSVKGMCFGFRVFPWNGKKGEIPRKMYTKWMDYDKIKNGFFIRNRKSGDFFVLDDSGHRKKLSDYFITEKIPAGERDTYLLLAQQSQILWIVGGRMGKSAMLDGTTKRILEITVEDTAFEGADVPKGGTGNGLQQTT